MEEDFAEGTLVLEHLGSRGDLMGKSVYGNF